MNKDLIYQDVDLELKKLLSNIEDIKTDIDLYSVLVEEKVLQIV